MLIFKNNLISVCTRTRIAQALETYQCPDPHSRESCPTNPSTDIAGLMAVLPRLIALPASSGVTAAQRASWTAQLAKLPALPLEPASKKPPQYNAQKVAAASAGKPSRHNSENTQLYMAHPFRIFGTGKSDLSVAQQTYLERPSPCNDGWCQDIIFAAMLNLTDEATTQLVSRAEQGPAAGFRFGGFASHYQDYEPSLDHFGTCARNNGGGLCIVFFIWTFIGPNSYLPARTRTRGCTHHPHMYPPTHAPTQSSKATVTALLISIF